MTARSNSTKRLATFSHSSRQILEALNSSGWLACLGRMRERRMGMDHELRSRKLISRGFCIDPLLWRDSLEIDFMSQGAVQERGRQAGRQAGRQQVYERARVVNVGELSGGG
eukprot:754045-Hanusia_phi.AAC.4